MTEGGEKEQDILHFCQARRFKNRTQHALDKAEKDRKDEEDHGYVRGPHGNACLYRMQRITA